MENEQEVVVADRLEKGVIIEFASGDGYFFRAELLWEMRDRATEHVKSEEE
jgi:hypothetical protein